MFGQHIQFHYVSLNITREIIFSFGLDHEPESNTMMRPGTCRGGNAFVMLALPALLPVSEFNIMCVPEFGFDKEGKYLFSSMISTGRY